MADNMWNNIIKRLDRIDNHIAEDVAPKANKLLKESIRFSLVEWYNNYDPIMYERTYNFMKVEDGARASGRGSILTLTVDPGHMNNYPGFGGKALSASAAFDYFFVNGEHGHGKWMMKRSTPPAWYLEDNIYDMFGGRLDKIANETIEKILK